MHIKRANYVAILWANAHLPHPAVGFFPEDYGWFLKDGKLHIDWCEGPCMPSSDFFRIESESLNTNISYPDENEDKASDENDCIGSNDEACSEDSNPEDSQ